MGKVRSGALRRARLMGGALGLALAVLVPLGAASAGATESARAAVPGGKELAAALGASPRSTVTRAVLTRAAQLPSPFRAGAAAPVTPAAPSGRTMPLLARPRLTSGDRAAGSASTPLISCTPRGAGCDSVSTSSGGTTTNRAGLGATATGQLYGEDIEPPDQGLCAGNGDVMEVVNLGELQVFNSALRPISPITSLDSLMGLTARGWSSGGDIMCMYDPDHGGHWFVTEFVSTTSEASGGALTGCFTGVYDACREGIAVSTTADPLTTSWNVYFLDPNTVSPTDPGAGYLLNDFAKIGNTRDAFLLFYDEFNLNGSTIPPCPAYGCGGFNAAQQLAFSKAELEAGAATVNAVHVNMGTDPSIQPPDGSCASGPTAGFTCWYSVIPAVSPSDSDFDNASGGTGFMAATLDFTGQGDSRVATFDWTHLSALNSPGCSSCSTIGFSGQIFNGTEPYVDPGVNAPQKLGILDLGTYCGALGLATEAHCPEGGIATNGDNVTQDSYEGGHLWFAASTLVDEAFRGFHETHVGAAYWIVTPVAPSTVTPTFALTSQGYAAAAHEEMEFPTLVGGGSQGLLSFTLSGNGGPSGADDGGYFPSSAYGLVTTTSGGITGATLHISAVGLAPQDGFTEYQGLPGPTRPRWGDYGAAVYQPGTGWYFASEYIPSAACQPAVWYHTGKTCGGTRDELANYGTSISLLR